MASYVDNGVNNAGTVIFQQPAITASMTPLVDGGISYGAPMNFGVATGPNVSDTNLPAVAMLCQNVSGPGGALRKSANVLVAASATRLLSASDLAGQSFNIYREDCAQVASGGSFVFDANGNATVNDQSGTVVYSATTVTMALNGQPAYTPSTGKYEVIYAFKYLGTNGTPFYSIVSHVAPVPSGLTKGAIATFTQQ